MPSTTDAAFEEAIALLHTKPRIATSGIIPVPGQQMVSTVWCPTTGPSDGVLLIKYYQLDRNYECVPSPSATGEVHDARVVSIL